MRSSITAAGLLATGAAAFTDSSPFMLFSTAPIDIPAANAQLQSTSAVVDRAHAILSSCPTQSYTILTHPNAHASDLRDPITGACAAKSLCQSSNSTSIQTRFGVAEVVGEAIGGEALKAYIENACAGAEVRLTQLDALPVAREGRRSAMGKADEQIGAMLDSYDADFVKSVGVDGYTVLYFASPHEPPRSYESEFADAVPMELRRRLEEGVLERADGAKYNSTVPLFVKYQFFTPGLFMAFLGSVVMFAMLYVGLSAVASLQVSYGAFDKEMGPAAQKKAQ